MKHDTRYKLVSMWSDFLDRVLPNHYSCFGCGKSVGFYKEFLCINCINEFERALHSCRICGAGIYENRAICSDCIRENPIIVFKRITNCFHYNQFARHLLHRYKYGHERHLAHLFANLLANRLEFEKIEFDIIVPLISGKKRIAMRGFDHIMDICVELSKLVDRPVVMLLNRKVHNQAQILKSAYSRAHDLENAFEYRKSAWDKFIRDAGQEGMLKSGKNVDTTKNLLADSRAGLKILLIDDVYTTGSTMRSAGMELSKYFDNISAITLFHGNIADLKREV